MTITVEDIVTELRANPYDSFLTKFARLVPYDPNFVGHQFIYRPAVDEPYSNQPEEDTKQEFVYEAYEALYVTAEREFFRTQKPATLIDIRALIDSGVKATVVASNSKFWLNELQRSVVWSRNKHDALLLGSSGGVSFYTDTYRHPEHKVFELDTFFAVREDEKHAIHIEGPSVISGVKGNVTTKFISQILFMAGV